MRLFRRHRCESQAPASASPRIKRQAQVTVEFALVMPMLFTIICACIDLSFIFFQDHTIHSAARLAARQAATGATDATLNTFIINYCNGFNISTSQILIQERDVNGTLVGTTPAANQTGGPRTPGDSVFISITHHLFFMTYLQTLFTNMGLSAVTAGSQFQVE